MPTRRRPAAREAAIGLTLSVGLTLSLALVGCSPDAAVPTPPEPTAEPIFASDEEALAAAEEAYAAYLEVTDVLGSNPDADLGSLDALVTPEYRDIPKETIASLHGSGRVIRGITRFDSMTLQQITHEEKNGVTITLYVCLDVSDVRVLEGGVDVTPEREERVMLEVEMQTATESPQQLLLARSDQWTGESKC